MAEAQVLKSKEYETIYILRPDVDADAADKVQGRVSEVVGRDNGKLVKVESWGRRKLAYPVRKQRKGVYVYVKYIGRGGLVQELERNLKLQDAVLKFQTVQTAHEVDIQTVTVDPEEIKFQRVNVRSIPAALARIAQAEGIQVDRDVLEALALKAEGDLRAAYYRDKLATFALGSDDPARVQVSLIGDFEGRPVS